MIEGFAREMPEEQMAEAIAMAHGYIREICEMQEELAAEGRRGQEAVRDAAARRARPGRAASEIPTTSCSRPSRPTASKPGPRPCAAVKDQALAEDSFRDPAAEAPPPPRRSHRLARVWRAQWSAS